MAVVTNGSTVLGDTANTTSYQGPNSSTTWTPAAGDLLVVGASASGTVASTPTMAASANSLTFTRLTSTVSNSGADTLYLFIADQLVPASPSAMTVTFNCSQDAATGCILTVARVAGMSRASTKAIRTVAGTQQLAVSGEVNAGSAPTITFANSCLTTNPTLYFFMVNVATGTTPPTNWTEQVDATYATPTKGGGYDSRDSGFTGTQIALASTSNGTCCAIGVELDASGPPPLTRSFAIGRASTW